MPSRWGALWRRRLERSRDEPGCAAVLAGGEEGLLAVVAFRARWALGVPVVVIAGCALTARPVGELPQERGQAVQETESDAVRLDRLAKEVLAASQARPEDAQAALAATVLLFQAADLHLQRGWVAALDARPGASIEQVLGADEWIAEELRGEILSLCTAGLEVAERAAALRPGDVAAELHRGLHLSLIAWANGPARSLLAGYGPRLVAAMDAAVAADPTFDHAAPLRLQGRFRGKAPWPFGDLELARSALSRACDQAPITVNRLFYGDVLWAAGEREAARDQWQAAASAEGVESTRWSQPLLQELARRRIAALASGGA